MGVVDHRGCPDGSAIIYGRCTDRWTCEARLVDPDGANDRLQLDGLGSQTGQFMWQPTRGG